MNNDQGPRVGGAPADPVPVAAGPEQCLEPRGHQRFNTYTEAEIRKCKPVRQPKFPVLKLQTNLLTVI